jgi:hypothetical protein
VLLGGYVLPFPELGPDAPRVGVFALKMNARGEVVFRRSVEDTDPEAARPLLENVTLDAEGRLLWLETAPHPSWLSLLRATDPRASEPDYLARIELPGAFTLLRHSAEGERYVGFARADAGAVYLTTDTADGRNAVMRLNPQGEVLWRRELPFGVHDVAEDGAGGVWVGGGVYRTPSRSDARALHYDQGGMLLGELSIGDAHEPERKAEVRRSIRQFVYDGRGRLWLSGIFKDSMALGRFAFSTRPLESRGFLAVLDGALRPASAHLLERGDEATLARVGERVLVARQDQDARCFVHSLGVSGDGGAR